MAFHKLHTFVIKLLTFVLIVPLGHAAESLPYTRPDFGRWVIPTKGEIWPQPQQRTASQNVFVLRPTSFQFKVQRDVSFNMPPHFVISLMLLDNWRTMRHHRRCYRQVLPDHLLSWRKISPNGRIVDSIRSPAQDLSRFCRNQSEEALRSLSPR